MSIEMTTVFWTNGACHLVGITDVYTYSLDLMIDDRIPI